ncbi:MAG TPA: hypothetical protein EYQ31_14300 [Candidatus Handelsmanbacteria bacterium]|nr:hypothetical protein [Candidatus Handelsmanbacteria bacterium]
MRPQLPDHRDEHRCRQKNPSFVGTASSQPYPCNDLHWMVRQIVDAFGPERCVYGSNFPTAQYNQTLSYGETMRLFAEAIELTVV